MFGHLRVLSCLVASILCPLGIGFGARSAAASQDCRALAVTERGSRAASQLTRVLLPRITIEESGTYCLGQDVNQAALRDPVRGREIFAQVESMIRIRANDVTLDMAGHTVSNEMRPGMTLIWFSKFTRGEPDGTRLRQIRVRNGKLVSPGPLGIGIDLLASKPYGSRSLLAVSPPEGVQVTDLFEDTRHVVDSMTIVAGKRAVEIDGKNNVIRNNRMVIDGATAIVAQGPGIVIENNLIEVRDDPRFASDHGRGFDPRTPFPIRLIQADGAIIRNNEIRLTSHGAHKRLPAAIELIASKDVVIEGNRVRGMDALVHSDSKSSHRDVSNESANCPPAARRFIPPDETGDAIPAPVPACR